MRRNTMRFTVEYYDVEAKPDTKSGARTLDEYSQPFHDLLYLLPPGSRAASLMPELYEEEQNEDGTWHRVDPTVEPTCR